uniref:zinc finger CCCH domain-containing protein 30-like n=1 Tax=Erigeron canadensis TaxID=72917 RepID=UPI001CB92900|nr:zinc finger CCCH domain-containing protein 30-like [Erigeron canadensis]
MHNSKIPWALSSGNMNDLTNTVELELSFANLLKRAAENDENGFNLLMDRIGSAIYEMGVWYGVKNSSDPLMSTMHRTPLMMAASYGSLDVLKFILSVSESNVNEIYGKDNTTALHCAASSGSHNAIKVVETLLAFNANPKLVDGEGRLPVDVVYMPDELQWSKFVIKNILAEESEKKEYQVDPPFSDLNSDICSSDDFRMFSYKIYPCARAGISHDRTQCPFYHSAGYERRRDPHEFRYRSDLCFSFLKRRQCCSGDNCMFSHGYYERGLHPELYRTKFCRNTESCKRKVCFYAHTQQELRSRYAAAMSAIPSPRVWASPRVIPTHADRPSSSAEDTRFK